MSDILTYFSLLDPLALLRSLPGNTAQGILWGLMALGVFITYKLLDFADLSVDGSFATGGAVCVMLMLKGVPVGVSLLAATAAGLLAGLVTGLLHTLLRIPAILSGILTQIALYSVNLNILGKSNQGISVDQYPLWLSLRYVNRSILVALLFAALIILLLYWYFGTEQGCAIRATGCNAAMAEAQGIHIRFTTVLALALSNGLVALSGALLSQYQGFADVNMGRGAIVIGLAAVIIGEVLCRAIFKKGAAFWVRMLFVIIGGIVYYYAIGLVLWLQMPTDNMKLFTAAIVAIFLAVPNLRSSERFGRKKKKEADTRA